MANIFLKKNPGCTASLRSTTIVTRLTEHDDVIKSLLRRAPHLGPAGPAWRALKTSSL